MLLIVAMSPRAGKHHRNDRDVEFIISVVDGWIVRCETRILVQCPTDSGFTVTQEDGQTDSILRCQRCFGCNFRLPKIFEGSIKSSRHESGTSDSCFNLPGILDFRVSVTVKRQENIHYTTKLHGSERNAILPVGSQTGDNPVLHDGEHTIVNDSVGTVNNEDDIE